MNILIAEDDVEVSSILTQALTEEGYVTEVVSDGRQAYTMANSGR